MTVRCPICYDTFEGDVIDDAPDIAPGDQLVDHLTDAHNPTLSKRLSEGVMLDA